MAPVSAILVGRWSVGFDKSRGITILSFQFNDREPINLALSKDQASKIAKALRTQPKSSPEKPKRAR
jgi:hypothetical protein